MLVALIIIVVIVDIIIPTIIMPTLSNNSFIITITTLIVVVDISIIVILVNIIFYDELFKSTLRLTQSCLLEALTHFSHYTIIWKVGIVIITVAFTIINMSMISIIMRRMVVFSNDNVNSDDVNYYTMSTNYTTRDIPDKERCATSDIWRLTFRASPMSLV